MRPLSRLPRIYIAIIAVVVLAIVGLGVATLTHNSKTTSSSTSIVVTAGDCQSSQVTFSSPGAPAIIPSGTYVGITITNKSGHSCKFSKVSQQVLVSSKGKATSTVYGYGLVFAQGWASGSPVGPISTLRGTAGSVPLTLAVGIPAAIPTAEFTLGATKGSSVKGCNPEKVNYIAFSLDKVHWQAVDFHASSYFKNGLEVCTGTVSNLNTSPVSLIPPANKKPPGTHGHPTTTTTKK